MLIKQNTSARLQVPGWSFGPNAFKTGINHSVATFLQQKLQFLGTPFKPLGQIQELHEGI